MEKLVRFGGYELEIIADGLFFQPNDCFTEPVFIRFQNLTAEQLSLIIDIENKIERICTESAAVVNTLVMEAVANEV